ncbi:NAD(P)H-dependent FMN reductase [Rhodopseudomonas faecalis]|uniref:NAD(P)H-dependent FMN reductase n=2 Tax=Rhodopseudomonas faecalis TaxID=99655 RepID=A0A318TG96_9BRAD|nr:NAD(P)H-dependent FMN reductase [Rhodopseudomonas faecalis]
MSAVTMSAVKILVIPGSLRTGSLNIKLAQVAIAALARAGADVTELSLADYPLPIYDGDLEARSGVPDAAVQLKRMIGAHQGVLLVTPEYNSAPPPLLKNAIDWVSRIQDPGESAGEVFRHRAFALAAASAGKLGGARCLAALRLILSGCRAPVIPNQLTLSFADQAYDDQGRLKNNADVEALQAMVQQLIAFAQQMK